MPFRQAIFVDWLVGIVSEIVVLLIPKPCGGRVVIREYRVDHVNFSVRWPCLSRFFLRPRPSLQTCIPLHCFTRFK